MGGGVYGGGVYGGGGCIVEVCARISVGRKQLRGEEGDKEVNAVFGNVKTEQRRRVMLQEDLRVTLMRLDEANPIPPCVTSNTSGEIMAHFTLLSREP